MPLFPLQFLEQKKQTMEKKTKETPLTGCLNAMTRFCSAHFI
jgi:hypothetical protein